MLGYVLSVLFGYGVGGWNYPVHLFVGRTPDRGMCRMGRALWDIFLLSGVMGRTGMFDYWFWLGFSMKSGAIMGKQCSSSRAVCNGPQKVIIGDLKQRYLVLQTVYEQPNSNLTMDSARS